MNRPGCLCSPACLIRRRLYRRASQEGSMLFRPRRRDLASPESVLFHTAVLAAFGSLLDSRQDLVVAGAAA